VIDEAVTSLRLQLRAAGFFPIPLSGKNPSPMEGWQTKRNTNADEIKLWAKLYEYNSNTGILAENCPGLDIDILDEDAAEAMEVLAREHFEEGGIITTRIGNWPKRLIPLRTSEPFRKLVRSFLAPDGSKHKIEILGEGQQWVALGDHPDTKAPYMVSRARTLNATIYLTSGLTISSGFSLPLRRC
jgi:Bifunctional DNA primase/polymerase, N-terminal